MELADFNGAYSSPWFGFPSGMATSHAMSAITEMSIQAVMSVIIN